MLVLAKKIMILQNGVAHSRLGKIDRDKVGNDEVESEESRG